MPNDKTDDESLSSEKIIQEDYHKSYPPAQSTNIVVDDNPGYPAPSGDPYILDYPDRINIPSPSPDTGIVVGRMIIDDGLDSPYLAPAIYLGSAIKPSNPDYPPLISLDLVNDRLATQDINGNFVIDNIQPGDYGLIIWSPYSQTLITDSTDSSSPLVISIVPGSVLDLGTIVIP